MAQRRDQVLRAVREASRSDVAALARRVGLHPNSVRFHLDRLVADGLVERFRGAARGKGRPADEFSARPGAALGLQRRYRVLAEVLLAGYAAGARDPAEAGACWGRGLGESPETPDGVLRLLDDLGFDPETGADPHRVRLRHCPFLELATDRTVCTVHRGILDGALEGSPLRTRSLLPFADSGACVVELEDVRG